MTAVPVAVVPVMVMPAPMTMAPVMTVPVMMVPVVSPPHFFRLDPIDLVARGHGRMGPFIAAKLSARLKRLRCKRRGLRARSQRGGERDAEGQSKCEFQKIPAFHDVFLFESERVMRSEFRRVEMNGR
jgi:hypothetical protein